MSTVISVTDDDTVGIDMETTVLTIEEAGVAKQ